MAVEVRKCWFPRHQRDELGINPATVLQALQLAPLEHAPLPVKACELHQMKALAPLGPLAAVHFNHLIMNDSGVR